MLIRAYNSIRSHLYSLIYMPWLRRRFAKCGEDVVVDRNAILAGMNNFIFGNHIYIGPNSVIYSTDAKLYIGNYVTIGPNLAIISGDHRFDVVGEYIWFNNVKLPENDQDIIIEDDVWIGCNVTILKGVRIGEGSIVAAGAVVTKNIPRYTIYYGNDRYRARFSEKEIEEHKLVLSKKRL